MTGIMGAMSYTCVPTRHIGRYEKISRPSSRSQRKHPAHAEVPRAVRRARPTRRGKRDGKGTCSPVGPVPGVGCLVPSTGGCRDLYSVIYQSRLHCVN